MARFSYTAENTEGDIYRGVADAQDRFALYKMVRREGGKIVSVKEEGNDNPWSFAYWNAKFTTVPEQERIMFARNLGSMLVAGLPLSRSLAVLERQTKNPKLSSILAQLESDIRRGDQFNEALGKFDDVFSDLFIAMVRSGEEAGDLPNALKNISEQMDRSYTLKKKVKGAMIYPTIIVVAIIGIGILMLTQVVPTLAQTFDELGAELPASTQSVIAISDFLINNTVSAIILVVVGFFTIRFSLKTTYGRRARDWMFLKIPIIGTIVQEINAARMARTMQSLLSSGVDMLTAISITNEVIQNSFFNDVLVHAGENVKGGSSLSEAFMEREDLFPPLVGEMISVGEETGALTEMLERLADFYEEEVSRKTKDMSTIIEPFLMLLIGAGVGFFAISMVSPIYSLSENI